MSENKVSLTDTVKFKYLDWNNGVISPKPITVKKLIDDWMGECDFLGSNDDILEEVRINGEIFATFDDKNTIGDMMEYLVKATGYPPSEK